MKTINLVGNKFGRLTVVEKTLNHIYPSGKTASMWSCLCDCGNILITKGGSLKSGHTTSCGCIKKNNNVLRLTTHGMTSTSTYKTWKYMLTRCTNPNNTHFHNY